MANSSLQYYEESQEIDVGRLAIAFLVGAGVSLVLGYIYALLAYIIPFPYVTFFLAVGLGMALGLIARLLVRLLRIRGARSRILLLLGMIIMTYYFHWVAYLMALMPDSSLAIGSYLGNIGWIFSPDLSFFRIIVDLSTFGAWSMFGITFAGTMLILVWLIELGVIAITAWRSGTTTSIIPYSEQSDKWYEKITLEDQFRLVASRKSAEKIIIEEGVLGFIDGLGHGLGHMHSKIHIYQDEDSSDQYITLEKVTISNKGQGSELRNPVVDNLRISSQDARAILSKYRNRKEKFEVF